MTGKQSMVVMIGLLLIWLNLWSSGFRFPSTGVTTAPATIGSSGGSGLTPGQGQAGQGSNSLGGGGSW